jgi:hypothetical protein
MVVKTRTALVVFVSAAAFGACAQAAVKGHCTFDGKQLAFVDAYAAMAPGLFDDSGKVPMLWLTTKPLDHAKLAGVKPEDIDDAILDQAFELDSAKMELRLDAEGKVVEGLNLYVPPGNNRSVSSNEVGKLGMKASTAAHIAGHFSLADDKELKCELDFDVPLAGKGPPPKPVPPPKPWGTVLPAGGGEPGQVYMAMHKAALAKDAAAMLKLANKAHAAEMRQSMKDPEFHKMLELIQMMEPAEVHVVSGQADATRAELQVAGKDSDGAIMSGTVKLVREDDAWKIDEVNTTSKAK